MRRVGALFFGIALATVPLALGCGLRSLEDPDGGPPRDAASADGGRADGGDAGGGDAVDGARGTCRVECSGAQSCSGSLSCEGGVGCRACTGIQSCIVPDTCGLCP